MPEITIAETVDCKNCGTTYSGNFCPQCGQKYLSRRFNLRDSVSHLFATVFNFDRGLWFISVELIRRPGHVLHNYLNGITVPYFHPFRFLFLWLTLQVFVMVSGGVFDAVQETFVAGKQANPMQMHMMAVLNSYVHVLIALSMPVLAAGSWLFFRKSGYNYAEHLIISCFAYGETIVITLLILPVFWINRELYIALNMGLLAISIAYFTYVYLSFFKGRKWLILIKAIGAYLLWFIGFAVITMLALMVYVQILISTNPEFMKQLKEASAQ